MRLALMTGPARIALPRRTRLVALLAVLLAQTFFFLLSTHWPIEVQGDNDRYEVGGWNLASGHGYALPLTGPGATNDPEIYGWVCGRHPTACLPDTTHPTAIYLPGYSVVIAGVYALLGRHVVALWATNLVLLWALFVFFELLASRLLDRYGYVFAMGVACTYPFLAHQAARIMSDHLYSVVWLAAFAAFALLRPGIWRGAAFGATMAAASLVRPYGLFAFPAIWALSLIGKPKERLVMSRREWVAGLVAFVLPFAIWTARNDYWYGRPLPLTTGGAGALLYQSSLEWEMDLSDPVVGGNWYTETTARFGDIMSRRGSQLETAEAIRRIRAHPWKFAERVAFHVPRLWISGATRYWPLSVAYLGGLLVLGVAGAWTARRDARFWPLIVGVFLTWACLLPLPGEARRTLPLRLPMLLLAGAFIGPRLERFVRSRARLAVAARAAPVKERARSAESAR